MNLLAVNYPDVHILTMILQIEHSTVDFSTMNLPENFMPHNSIRTFQIR
jgi:hypothetical protein